MERSAGLGGVREIHDATHGPGSDRGRLRGAGACEMVGRYDGTSLLVEKEKASDTTYRKNWDNPREPRSAQIERQQDRPRRIITPKKKSRGPSR